MFNNFGKFISNLKDKVLEKEILNSSIEKIIKDELGSSNLNIKVNKNNKNIFIKANNLIKTSIKIKEDKIKDRIKDELGLEINKII